jgi:hypothetical protein
MDLHRVENLEELAFVQLEYLMEFPKVELKAKKEAFYSDLLQVVGMLVL